MRWIAVCIAVLTASAASAQEDDGSWLERLIETELSSGDGVDVDLTGFRGALSSTASLDRMTIADRDGVWLILEDAQLVWTRSALLQGQLLVETLSAERLQVLRPPRAEPSGVDLPPAEAAPFSLPDLPVQIDLGGFSIAEVDLAAPVMGRAAVFSIDGAAELADGAGNARLDVMRLDGPRGVFNLDLRYANDTRELNLGLVVDEDANGLVAEMLALPGAPALRFDVGGSGPLTSFVADISLETDGQPRLTGQVVSERLSETDNQRLTVDVTGDISPLLQPDYRSFFGTEVSLQSRATLYDDGRIALDDLALSSEALDLSGSLALDQNRQPAAFALDGQIRGSAGGAVRLPVPGATVLVDEVTLTAAYDAARDDGFSARFDLQNLVADDLSIGALALEATGQILQSGGVVRAVTADISAQTDAVRHLDQALHEALGATHQAAAQVSWASDMPVSIEDLTVTSGELRLDGMASARFTEGALPTDFDLRVTIDDLSRFAAVSGQPLDGGVVTTARGTVDPLSGAIALELFGTAQDLHMAEAVPPALFAGETELDLALTRDTTGLTLDRLRLSNNALDLDGSGALSSTDGSGSVTLRLADLGLFNDVIRGPGEVRLDADRVASGPWRVDAGITAPLGTSIALDGQIMVQDDVELDLAASGSVPLAFANPALSPRSVTGTMGFDLTVRGAPALESVAGTFRTSGARLSLPTLRTALDSLSVTGSLNAGQVRADISASPEGGGSLDGDVSVNLLTPGIGLDATVTGRALRLTDPNLYDMQVDQVDVRYRGVIAGRSALSGTIALGQTEVRIPETGLGASDIPEIRHVGETAAERRTRAAAGLIQEGSGNGASAPINLDLLISAPARVFIRGRGVDAELGGSLRVGGTSANVLPSGRFDLLRGRLNLLGTRLELTEGSASLQGSFEPFVRLLATSRAGSYTIAIGVVGRVTNPDISFTSDPSLPEDEVLAQLLFGRSVSALSAFQLLQLADAAASLAGGSGSSGVFASIRDGLGLDDLDLETDAEGGAGVRAGRYISENVYSDVAIDSNGQTDLSLNIDLTPDITARGSFSSDGSSSVGVYFERDY